MTRGPDEYERNAHLKITCRACGVRFYEEEGSCPDCGDDQWSEPEEDGDNDDDFAPGPARDMADAVHYALSAMARESAHLEGPSAEERAMLIGPPLTATEIELRMMAFKLRHSWREAETLSLFCSPLVSRMAQVLHCEARPLTDDMRQMIDDFEAHGMRVWPLPKRLFFFSDDQPFFIGWDLAKPEEGTGHEESTTATK